MSATVVVRNRKPDNNAKSDNSKSEDANRKKSRRSCKSKRRNKEPPNQVACGDADNVPANNKQKPRYSRSTSLKTVSKGEKEKSFSLPADGKARPGKDAKKSRSGTLLSTIPDSVKAKRRKRKMSRKISNLVFVMPKTDDPQAKAQAASEKKVSKLVRYMKKYWKIHVDKKYYPVKIDYRMPDRMTHQRPNNWWLLKRARQKQLDHTGFFSNVRERYHDLGPPELDSSMLVFKNMHDDLLTDPTKFIQDRQLKDELIRKCNAPLVRLPRARVRRPLFSKGRVKVGAGGMIDINKYVKQGYAFQNAIRGDRTYTQTLDLYMDQKGQGHADLASAFGFVPRKAPEPGDSKKREESANASKPSGTSDMEDHGLEIKALADDTKSEKIDDRNHQRNVLNFENMLSAIYLLIKSMLNLKQSHLKSPYPLPFRVMRSLRSLSPKDEQRKKKSAVARLTCKSAPPQRPKKPSAQAALGNASHKSEDAEEEEEEDDDEEEEEESGNEEGSDLESKLNQMEKAIFYPEGTDELITEEEEEDEYLDETREEMLLRKAKEERKLPVIRIPSPEKIASSVVATVKNLHIQKSKKQSVSPEDKIRSFQESPDKAMQRIKATFDQYNRLFYGGEMEKPPIWVNINIDNVLIQSAKFMPRASRKNIQPGKLNGDGLASPLTPLPSTAKIPHVAEIHTPVLTGLESPPKINSEEQSRLNLLAKNPEAANDKPPPSPVAHLYKVAGVTTTEKSMFDILITLKKKFRVTEKSVGFYYASATDKADWDTMNRFKHKIRSLYSCPIYERSIAIMRESVNFPLPGEKSPSSLGLAGKRPAIWYRLLRDQFEEIGASRHEGCVSLLANLLKYCEVDMKARPKMTNRLCLLVVSLPTTELGTRPWQLAVKFLLENLLGMPMELFYHWLDYRSLPPLI